MQGGNDDHLRHATSGHHPIATSRLGTHREHRRVRCSHCGVCPGKSELPEGKPLQPLTSASISALNELHTLDGAIALAPKVIALISEDPPRLLNLLVVPDLHDVPGIVGVDRLYHRIR